MNKLLYVVLLFGGESLTFSATKTEIDVNLQISKYEEAELEE